LEYLLTFNILALYLITVKGKPDIKKDENSLSNQLKDFLDKALTVDSAKRASTDELLQHEFLNKKEGLQFLEDNITAIINRKRDTME
jgi:serine/threonine protein kinase